jgi:hypothetical protein
MAGQRGRGPTGGDDHELRPDALVQRLSGGGGPRPTVVLRGLVGEGATEGSWRLYLSQQLDEYVEVDAADVLHSEPVDASVPLAGTALWVRAGASLRYTQVSSRQVQADFLQGGIATRHLAGAATSSFGGGYLSETGYACTRNYVCSVNPHIPACQDRSQFCGSLGCDPSGAFCPTGPFVQGC